MTARFEFECKDSMVADIEAIVDRTGLQETEVIRRLIRLGLQDVDEIDDEVLFGAVSGSKTVNATE